MINTTFIQLCEKVQPNYVECNSKLKKNSVIETMDCYNNRNKNGILQIVKFELQIDFIKKNTSVYLHYSQGHIV